MEIKSITISGGDNQTIEKQQIVVEYNPVSPPTYATTIAQLNATIASCDAKISEIQQKKDRVSKDFDSQIALYIAQKNAVIDILDGINKSEDIPYTVEDLPTKEDVK